MSVNQLRPEHAQLAREVDQLLEAMSGELNVTMNPHRMALRQLGLEPMGWVPKPYNDEAWKTWSELIRRNPEDLETLHHLTVMHHARAIDLETGKDPRQSDEDWEKALKNWHRLWKAVPFWNRLAEIACKGAKREAVDKLRENFPALLLQIHYDIAFDPETPHYRAKYHIKLALDSPFPDEEKDKVRRETYVHFIRGVSDNVWQSSEPGIIKQGTDQIEKYLEMDPDCPAALEDALRLQVRLLMAWFNDLRALGEENDASRKGLFNQIKNAADQWKPYFGQLAEKAGNLEEELRHNLALWHRVMGDVHGALEHLQEAMELYRAGAKVGKDEDDNDERKLCARRIGETRAALALEKAHQGDKSAKSLCDQVWKQKDLSVFAHFRLANAYALIKEFDQAEAVCRAGQALEVDSSEIDALEEHEKALQQLARLLEEIGEVRLHEQIGGFLKRAKEHMEAGRMAEALPILNQAANLAPEAGTVYFYRCHCHLALDQTEKAAEDLQKFKKLEQGEEAQQAGAELEATVKQRQELIKKFGQEGLQLRTLAQDEFRAERYQQAADLLRKAISASPKAGRAELQKELAIVLTGWATRAVNDAIEDRHLTDEAKARICREALGRMEEATKLDPANTNAAQNLKSLKQVIEQMANAQAFARQKAALLAEYGNERALELQQRAVQSFNAGQFAQAVDLLRQALKESPSSIKLKEELSTVLTEAAITTFNQQASSGSPPSRTMLDITEAMLTEAARLNPSNQRAKENLTTVTLTRSRINTWE